MKNLCLLLALVLIGSLTAQDIEFSDLDKSPMDAAHYPTRSAYKNYLPEDDPDRRRKIKVLYSRPQVKQRAIFGDLLPYGEDYRLGANEATEITFYQAVEIGNVRLPAGTYTMFAQVYPDQWVFKISEERFIGGAANRDITKDVVAVTVPTRYVPKRREYFTIGFQKINENRVHLLAEWDHTHAALPINLSPPEMAGEDVSPMDLVQYPERSRLRNFVEKEDLAANEPKVRVVYSRPQLNGRTAFGGLLAYGELWRLGANETTLVTFFEDVTIDGKKVKAGNYGLFAKVNEDNWEFVLHEDTQSWGAANHDDKSNVVTVRATTESTSEKLEALSMALVERGDNQVELVVAWENTMARLPITLSAK